MHKRDGEGHSRDDISQKRTGRDPENYEKNDAHILLEVVPRSKKESSTFVLNVYSSPSKKGLTKNFEDLISETLTIAGDNRLVIGGDFNAPHTQWGYGHSFKKGKNLAHLIEEAGLTLLNEPASHTRVGAGPYRDTTPDLTICRRAGKITWESTFEDLGNDNRILSIALGEARVTKGIKHKFRLVDWDKFRKIRDKKEQGPIRNIEEWNGELLQDVQKATTEMDWDDWDARREHEDDDNGGGHSPRVDRNLAHLIQAKKSIQKRLQGQKHNRNLRRKIAELNKTIEAHRAQLCTQDWDEVCDAMDGNINTGKTWKILKHLLDPSGTTTVAKAEMTKLRHKYKGNIREMGDEIVKLNLERPPAVEHRNYSSSPNEDLDRDFSQQEIKAVLQTIKTKSAPGPDKVTNKMLRNLDDQVMSRMTDYINECWRNGGIPDEWKRTATIRQDEEESIQVDMGRAGTPQGSVVSPMLFNLVMIGI
ncbi:uncharacterized protein [Dermacentor albipictus]|uniref:uncharacterized protein n=1 Tax=Dermacentor albipictus TaxID=60249 RepID=UPI0038FC1701